MISKDNMKKMSRLENQLVVSLNKLPDKKKIQNLQERGVSLGREAEVNIEVVESTAEEVSIVEEVIGVEVDLTNRTPKNKMVKKMRTSTGEMRPDIEEVEAAEAVEIMKKHMIELMVMVKLLMEKAMMVRLDHGEEEALVEGANIEVEVNTEVVVSIEAVVNIAVEVIEVEELVVEAEEVVEEAIIKVAMKESITTHKETIMHQRTI